MRAPAIPAPAATDASNTQPQAKTLPTPPTTTEKAKKGLTLTALYNVLEALREGRPLSAKEKQIHTQGLAGVLKELHDELDAAVLQAYGWPDLTPDEPGKDQLLTRLVALNAQRAAEEAQGTIRWLRPAFQAPEISLSNKELPTQVQQGLELDLAQKIQIPGANRCAVVATGSPWPATLPEQVRAVAQVLESSATALSLASLESRFKGRGPWKKGLPILLQTLEALGRAQQVELDGAVGWRA